MKSRFSTKQDEICRNITEMIDEIHSVCICGTHQNAVFLIGMIDLEYTYKDLTKKVDCDPDNKVCMMHHCESCSGSAALKKFLDDEHSHLVLCEFSFEMKQNNVEDFHQHLCSRWLGDAMCNTLCSSGSFVSHPGSDTVKSPSTIILFEPKDSFYDFKCLAWSFTRYKCWVRLLMLSMRSSLYSLNVIVSVASAARSVVCHLQ